MRPIVLLAVLALFAPLAAVAGDCDACLPEKMCVRHQKEQDEALAEFKKGYRDKDPMKRKQALDKLGKLNDEHLNHRSADVAEAIGGMLKDSDSGVRLGALTYLKTNQNVAKSRELIISTFDHLLGSVSKMKPTGKAGMGAAGKEYDDNYKMVQELMAAMQYLGGPEIVEPFLKAVDVDNPMLASEAIEKSASIHSAKLVEVYLDRFGKNCPAKSDQAKRHICEACAKSFQAQTTFAMALGADEEEWLKKARGFWKDHKKEYDPPPADPPKDGGAPK